MRRSLALMSQIRATNSSKLIDAQATSDRGLVEAILAAPTRRAEGEPAASPTPEL